MGAGLPASGKKSSSWVRILNEVARQVGAGGSDGEEWQNVRSFLRNKRYLIVLDDIDFDMWKVIRDYFPSNTLGSRE
ncbi:unnamed protein product [Urochloa humidicola]